MSFKPSAEQAPAIDTRGKDILVSASAGSGKTAVLVERVMQLLAKDQLNIDQLLLVTFTKEAAKNMRDRLRKRLVAANDAHLKEQVARLALANISTIHAFCEQLINRYYYVIDLDPQYRLVADAEQELLFDQAWQATQAAWLAPKPADQHDAFTRLVANFATGPVGSGLEAVVRQLDAAANAQPDPRGWLAGLAEKYALGADAELTRAPFFTELVGPVVTRELRALTEEWRALADRAPEIFAPRLAEDLALLTRAFHSDDTLADWATLAAVTEKKAYGRNPTKPKEDAPDEFPAVAAARKDLKQRLGELHDHFFNLTPGRVRQLMPQAQELVTTLAAVATDLRRRYQIEKQRRHLLDYADLEHYAAAILTGTNVNPLVQWDPATRAAKQRAAAQVRHELQQRYVEIMVDEYQDTNRLQDDLIHKLHDPARNHLFMVGDMKQSIYRFRQADPTLFAGYYRQFTEEASGAALDLSDNYRSQRLITAFTNRIFSQLMDRQLGEMAYDHKAELTAKAQWGDHLVAPEVLVYQRDAAPARANDLVRIHQPEMAMVGEVWMVGQRIQQMLAKETIVDPTTRKERPVTPGDIVILARTKAANNAIVDQFAKLNLPVVVHGVENYLQATEIRVVMALLRLVDNAAQDIPLVAVMRSPLIRVAPAATAAFGIQSGERTGFSEPEMAVLRATVPNGDYYAAVRACYDRWHQEEVAAAGIRPARPKDAGDQDRYARELAAALATDPACLAQRKFPDTSVNLGLLYLKLDRLFTLLDQLGRVARQQPLVDLIWALYQETGYLDYVGGMTGGPQRQANLHALYERASNYEEASFKGLYQFIHFIEQLQQKDDDLGVAPAELATDAINVMTIHGAKGLQFPVVFLINTNHRFRTPGGATVVAPRLGVGLALQEAVPEAPASVKEGLPQYDAIKDQLIRDNRAEEMRLLYVALTRAEQRLIVTAEQSPSDQRSQYKRWLPARDSGPVLATSCRLNARSLFDWLMQALIRTDNFPAELVPEDVAVTPAAGFQTAWSGRVATAATVTVNLRARTTPAPAHEPTAAGTGREFKALVNQVLTFTYPDPVATTTTAFQAVSTIREAFARQDPADLEMGRLVIDQHRVREGGAYLGPDKTSLGVPAFFQEQRADQRPSAAAVGTATHLVFQKLDLTRGAVTAAQVAETVARLVETGQIESQRVARAIDQAGIVAFYQTPLGEELLQDPGAVQREAPFSMLFPAAVLFKGLRDPESDVLIHGIIDGYQSQGDGIALFDYKTDRIRAAAADEDIARLVAKYQGQLVLYADALAKMTGTPLGRIKQQLYFVRARRLVTLGDATMGEYLE